MANGERLIAKGCDLARKAGLEALHTRGIDNLKSFRAVVDCPFVEVCGDSLDESGCRRIQRDRSRKYAVEINNPIRAGLIQSLGDEPKY